MDEQIMILKARPTLNSVFMFVKVLEIELNDKSKFVNLHHFVVIAAIKKLLR